MGDLYAGRISFDSSDETVYMQISIDDLDSAAWIGVEPSGHTVPGITEKGNYVVKLLEDAHPRRGQTARAEIQNEVEDGVLRLVGQTAFS
jgi:hypothetical protein